MKKISKNCQWLVKWVLTLVLGILVVLPAFASEEYTAIYGTGTHTFSLATGSPGELGMLKAITGVFNTKYDTSLCWRKAGSGKSLQLLKQKKVDIVMVHAPAAEKQAVKEGWAIKRSLIGSNEFYIVGPKIANETNGYFMTDSSTWVAAKKKWITSKFSSEAILFSLIPTTPFASLMGRLPDNHMQQNISISLFRMKGKISSAVLASTNSGRGFTTMPPMPSNTIINILL